MFAEIPKKLRKIAVDKAKVLYTGNLIFLHCCEDTFAINLFFDTAYTILQRKKT